MAGKTTCFCRALGGILRLAYNACALHVQVIAGQWQNLLKFSWTRPHTHVLNRVNPSCVANVANGSLPLLPQHFFCRLTVSMLDGQIATLCQHHCDSLPSKRFLESAQRHDVCHHILPNATTSKVAKCAPHCSALCDWGYACNNQCMLCHCAHDCVGPSTSTHIQRPTCISYIMYDKLHNL